VQQRVANIESSRVQDILRIINEIRSNQSELNYSLNYRFNVCLCQFYLIFVNFLEFTHQIGQTPYLPYLLYHTYTIAGQNRRQMGQTQIKLVKHTG